MGYEQPEWLVKWQRWPSLRAVARNNLFAIPSAIIQRSGPRVLQGAEILCRHLETARRR
jgi:iron complex transport system substrate-binding protein